MFQLQPKKKALALYRFICSLVSHKCFVDTDRTNWVYQECSLVHHGSSLELVYETFLVPQCPTLSTIKHCIKPKYLSVIDNKNINTQYQHSHICRATVLNLKCIPKTKSYLTLLSCHTEIVHLIMYMW